MKLTLTLIRNGCTESGRQGRYLGRMDEALEPESRQQIQQWSGQGRYPECQIMFTSGMLRCRETAGTIYPRAPMIVLKELTAFDYGLYSGKTYSEIVSDKHFAEWARAEQLRAYPDGEEPHDFMTRCTRAFRHITAEMTQKGLDSAAVVTHQAVIRTIMQRYYAPRSLYHDWKAEYGKGFTVCFDAELSILQLLQRL